MSTTHLVLDTRPARSLPAVDWPRSLARSCARIFALQDVMMLAYLTVAAVLVRVSPAGPLQSTCARAVFAAVVAQTLGCVVGRGLPLPQRVREVVYRASICGVLISNYLALRSFLQLVRSDTVDAALAQADLRLFGVEPSLWLERFNQRPIVEWFSFFYFSYFFIGIGYMLAVVW